MMDGNVTKVNLILTSPQLTISGAENEKSYLITLLRLLVYYFVVGQVLFYAYIMLYVDFAARQKSVENDKHLVRISVCW